MQYLLMIYKSESDEPIPGTKEFEEMMQGYGALNQELEKKGIMMGGNALDKITSSTTVRVRGGKTQTTDGPFAETKEQLAGYYLLDCKDLDEAIEQAAKIPSAVHGTIEIRPIMKFD